MNNENNINDENNNIQIITPQNIEIEPKNEINLVSENKIIEPNSNSEEPRLFNGLNNDENVKEINLGIRPTIKKIENIEKIEKIDTNQNEEKKQIEDLLRPVNKNTNLININPNTRKLKQKILLRKNY